MANKKIALITGITGQDGAYLADFLLNKNYKVYGGARKISDSDLWRLKELGILEKITLMKMDLSDIDSLSKSVIKSNPSEIYNLAGQGNVGISFKQPIQTCESNGIGFLKLVEIVKNFNRDIKIFQASTGILYGEVDTPTQNEKTPFNPHTSPYSVSKLFAFETARMYRHTHKMFVSNGILFAHESPLRDLSFVTRKITDGVARIKLGLSKELRLRDLSAKRDWGYAKEYVGAMWLMLQNPIPDDFVIATGETHSVKKFAEEAFDYVGLNWEKYVKVDSQSAQPENISYLRGDASKAKRELGWEPKVKFSNLIKIMVDADIKRLKNG